MRQETGQLRHRPSLLGAGLLALGLILFAQAAILQSFRQFYSQAAAQQASALTDRKLFSQARVEAQRAIRLYPYNAYALFRSGASDFAAGTAAEHQQRALPALQRALPYLPHLPNVLRLLGQTYYYLGQPRDAAATLDRFFAMAPTPSTTPAHLRLIRALAHFRSDGGARQGSAILPLHAASAHPENRSELAVPRLLNALVLNHPVSSEALIRQWIAEGTDQKLTTRQLQDLMAAAAASGKGAELAQALLRATDQGTRSPRLSKYLTGLLIRSHQYDQARQVVEQLRLKTPTDPEVLLMLGDIELQRGNQAAAAGHYREHLKLHPSSAARKEIEAKVGPLP